MTRPLGIDLFSGVGGFSLGFEQAGFDIAAAVEYDPIHAAAHHFNFPQTATLARSVVGLTGEEIRYAAGIGTKPVDVVFGGAPCQGFSLIGQRALDDPRNALVREFVRIVRELEAKCFVFENVKGLTLGKHRRFLDELISTFEAAGYDVRLPWQVLNANRYGTPQSRERLIIMGSRRGHRVPEYPEVCCLPADGSSHLPGFTLGPNCHDALSDLPDAELFDELVDCDEVHTERWQTPSRYAREMRCLDNRDWHFGYRRKWDPLLLTASTRTDHTVISRSRFASTPVGRVEPISRFYKLAPDGIANTLRAGSDSSRGAFTSPRPIHFLYHRCVTVREMARLHGFPDWFRFNHTKWHGARQIGNAVPPPLARAIASQVMLALGYKAVRPRKILKMGDPKLLKMDMSSASAHWDIPRPIGNRDRKSGQRKRKQIEIENQSSVRSYAC